MNEMTNVLKIFNQLQSTTKKTEKIEILKANERNIFIVKLKIILRFWNHFKNFKSSFGDSK